MEVEWKNGIQHWTGMRQGAEGGVQIPGHRLPLAPGQLRAWTEGALVSRQRAAVSTMRLPWVTGWGKERGTPSE